MEVKAQLLNLKEEVLKEIEAVKDPSSLNEIRIKYLGKKGVITSILKTLGSLKPEERKEVGQLANSIKEFLEEKIREYEELFKKRELEESLKREKIDVTLPHSWFE
ncbi:MAG TPA: phenylalanine--tRNA ligase subunit alpha, partial [Sulfurihydrogenibium azorense]|nr:phenylalanine--tRNA ligase subunit alpha [Sulfurihydrogenibium azorense]